MVDSKNAESEVALVVRCAMDSVQILINKNILDQA